MKKTDRVIIISGASAAQVHELVEYLRTVMASGAKPILIVGRDEVRALEEAVILREALRGVPRAEILPIREFRKKMRATNERSWGGSSFRGRRNGGTAVERRQTAMRRYGRKR